MIRDPSDGTVRDVQHRPEPLKPKAKLPESDQFGTGLRQPTRTDAQLRLERSREWLKTYFAKKEREHAERGSDEELPQAGHSVEGQRAAKPAS